jgi:hypothetical protein
MASSFKYLGSNDRVVSTTNLTEVFTEQSGTNSVFPLTQFSHFTRVYSGSSTDQTHLFDVTAGRSATTYDGVGTTSNIQTRMQVVYNQMAKVLLGTDQNGTPLQFSLDADTDSSNNILHNAYFVLFPRSSFKDKIKSGTFKMQLLLTSSAGDGDAGEVWLSDTSGTVNGTYVAPLIRECETGEYGLLFVSSSVNATTGAPIGGGGTSVGLNVKNNNALTGGLVFYEAGVAVVSPYIFSQYLSSGPATPSSEAYAGSITRNQRGLLGVTGKLSGSADIGESFMSASQFDNITYGLAHRILTASYQSVTELNSSIYFCRAFNNEFNYSSNPTYLSSSEIVVKEGDPLAQPASYITTVGLYDDNNQLLAVAKLSEPIKKTPDTELITRVRLDF